MHVSIRRYLQDDDEDMALARRLQQEEDEAASAAAIAQHGTISRSQPLSLPRPDLLLLWNGELHQSCASRRAMLSSSAAELLECVWAPADEAQQVQQGQGLPAQPEQGYAQRQQPPPPPPSDQPQAPQPVARGTPESERICAAAERGDVAGAT